MTPDMVMPIAPNIDRLGKRRPLCTKPQFPFPNCYFWMESTMQIRVKVRKPPNRHNEAEGIQLTLSSHAYLGEYWREQWYQLVENVKTFREQPNASPTPAEDTLAFPPPLREYPHLETTGIREVRNSSGSPLPSICEAIVEFNMFGWEHDPTTFQYIPLVDLSLDISQHIRADNIPSPADLWHEQETIGEIIEAGLKRRADTLSQPRRGVPPSYDASTHSKQLL
ncbi:hypothetical protein C8Q80DRAFT_924853 [Daedaleopsis nitida]|nr:hypothetical protein C8Q80DRAFT_924853 [Daedaleopsis nitida]